MGKARGAAWEPNLTAAANEDHKGYHAILSDFVAIAKGESRDAPNLDDGARAMALLEAVMKSAGVASAMKSR